MLGYLDDLHADFLAIWGIDIHRDTTLTGPEFFALAMRTFAFDGVMTARARAEDKAQQPIQAPATPAAAQPAARPAAQQGPAQVVELSAFRAMYPGVVEMSSDKQD
ncbi:hypothetical protein BBK82_03380 [Lentzea guizhouensis]|uniref:Uncharacterized protein n=1 Tax=Lentzea guizhouensis TaxID=1586287 RepID=A0A1B2HC10_9PSEU|nr:hypothetical protein [Lentzea guizhouensis]ANZ35257.1 hypothetical protein BBK82_03380 [Lentzea guizhouensis]